MAIEIKVYHLCSVRTEATQMTASVRLITSLMWYVGGYTGIYADYAISIKVSMIIHASKAQTIAIVLLFPLFPHIGHINL